MYAQPLYPGSPYPSPPHSPLPSQDLPPQPQLQPQPQPQPQPFPPQFHPQAQAQPQPQPQPQQFPYFQPRFDFSRAALLHRARAHPDACRLLTESDDGLRTVARRAGVNYMLLSQFVRSDDVHAIAWEFIEDAGDFSAWTRDAWCALFRTDLRLRWLRDQVAAARYADFDPACWVFDGPCVDKRHFTMADHVTRFVLLCENFRLVSGWDTGRFGRPAARLCLYKGILLLFLRKAAAEKHAESVLGCWELEEDDEMAEVVSVDSDTTMVTVDRL